MTSHDHLDVDISANTSFSHQPNLGLTNARMPSATTWFSWLRQLPPGTQYITQIFLTFSTTCKIVKFWLKHHKCRVYPHMRRKIHASKTPCIFTRERERESKLPSPNQGLGTIHKRFLPIFLVCMGWKDGTWDGGYYKYPKNNQVFKKSTMNIHFNNKKTITTTKKFLMVCLEV